MRTAINVLTCPKLRHSFLPWTLDALDANGADDSYEKNIWRDGPEANRIKCKYIGWSTLAGFHNPSGTRKACWDVLSYYAERTDIDQLLYCEDDLKVSKDAVTRILNHKIPDNAAFTTFFNYIIAPKSHSISTGPIFDVKWGGEMFFGTLCFLIPRRTLQWLTQRTYKEWGEPHRSLSRGAPDHKNGADALVAHALKNSPWPQYEIVHPSLVDHAGTKSCFDNHPFKKASRYVGDE